MVQEVFARAWERAPSLRGEGTERAWLFGIAVRVCRSFQRSPWRNRRVNGIPVGTHDDERPAPLEVSAVEQAEEDAQVQRAVASLPIKLREVVVLHYLEELDIESVARTLRIGRNTVDTRLHRARRKLMETLGEAP